MTAPKPRKTLRDSMQEKRKAAPQSQTPLRASAPRTDFSRPPMPQMSQPVRVEQPRVRPPMSTDQMPQYEDRPRAREMRGPKLTFTPRLIASACIGGLLLIGIIVMLTRGSAKQSASSTTTASESVPVAPQESATVEQVSALMNSLKKHILVPSDMPQVMQITNPEELIKKDVFFVGSEMDDVLMVFSKAGKAIIYSPKRDLIVNVGPVQIEPDATVKAPEEKTER